MLRLVKVITPDGQTIIGIQSGGLVYPTAFQRMADLFDLDPKELPRVQDAALSGQPLEEYRLMAPVESPSKVLCGGINYRSHKDENPKAVFPTRPSVFSKLPSSIVGPGHPIVLPSQDCQADYEVELALVIGRKVKGIARDEALKCVFGYTVLNDVSDRKMQFDLQHETLGKGVDTFCPIGPELILAQDISDPGQLHVRSYVNGEMRQDSSTSNMLFSIPELLEAISRYTTLLPGDVISTGTPAGVGLFRNPPVFLAPGDEVVVEVEEIGQLVNPVVAGW